MAAEPAEDAQREMLSLMTARIRDAADRGGADGTVLGVLSQMDLLGFLANHSQVIGLQIDAAADVAGLKAAVVQIDQAVALLQGSGVRIDRITRLVSELNTRLFARLWDLLAPANIVANSCLVVMGSEGRGEQILKTDQDNALLLRDGFDDPRLPGVAQRFNEALADFGYPPCPGGIMVTNPLWRQPLAGWRAAIRDWLYGPDADGPMRLAIFFDAAAVAGDARLLADAHDWLDQLVSGHDTFLARFAAAADQFPEPGPWWRRLTTARGEQALDLKKLGTFPIVHGARALALQHGVRATGTAQRLQALAAQGHLDADLARDLVDALHHLMGLRLWHQLRQRAQGLPPDNAVQPSALGVLERQPLRESLAIVRRFRQFLRVHFRLDAA